uniref:Pyroglutamyl-peptidase I n=1 Tax=Panagrellus redivivus TaxID=6233 RepID=A0A7E4ZWW0_PANRE
MPSTVVKPRKKLVLTGYGPFGEFKENPSSVLVERIAESGLPADVAAVFDLQTELLDVAYCKADDYVQNFVQKDPADFYIHLGVHPIARHVKLEQQSGSDGYCREDVLGACAINARSCVAPSCGTKERLHTKLNCVDAVAAIHEALGDKLEGLRVTTSDDPGTYLCGYIFYSTLKVNKGRSLFVHVPEFDSVATVEVVHQIVVEVTRQVARQIVHFED